jgi:hypothetical protein
LNYYTNQNNKLMKKFIVFVFCILAGWSAASAQTTDSTESQPVPTEQTTQDQPVQDQQTTPATTTDPDVNTQPENVTIVDPNATPPPAQQYSGGSTETETIRVYSGSHSGNNVIRTYEVPRPTSKPY